MLLFRRTRKLKPEKFQKQFIRLFQENISQKIYSGKKLKLSGQSLYSDGTIWYCDKKDKSKQNAFLQVLCTTEYWHL